jgi:hypothetical protein
MAATERIPPRQSVAAGALISRAQELARKGKPGPKPRVKRKKVAAPVNPVEAARRKKSTVNRVIATLKASFNHAYPSKQVKSRDAWSMLRKFRSVDSARARWLSLAEAMRLLNASAPGLRKLACGRAFDGMPRGRIVGCERSGFRFPFKYAPNSRKSGTPRRVPLPMRARSSSGTNRLAGSKVTNYLLGSMVYPGIG